MKHVKLSKETAEKLNIAKSHILAKEPQRARVTDDDTINTALEQYNKTAK